MRLKPNTNNVIHKLLTAPYPEAVISCYSGEWGWGESEQFRNYLIKDILYIYHSRFTVSAKQRKRDAIHLSIESSHSCSTITDENYRIFLV